MSPPARRPPGLSALSALYRALLRTLPRSWEDRDREDMLAFFRDQYRDAWGRGGPGAALVGAARACWDVVKTGVADRIAARGREGYDNRGGGVDVKETMAGTLADLRLAARSLRRSWGFTGVCVVTLALGVGPNTALFTVLHGLVLAPLPYPDADRLVAIRRDLVQRGIPNYPAAPADLVEYRAGSRAFTAIAGYMGAAPIVTDGPRPERLSGLWATPEIFDVLGVGPALGRPFRPEEGIAVDDDEQPLPIILSHGYWERAFGGDPGAIGRSLAIGNATARVVGVMPEGFRMLAAPDDGVPTQPDVIMPFTIDPVDPWRGSFFLRTIGRLAPGVSLEAARDQMAVVTVQQQERYANARAAGTTIRLEPLQRDVGADVRPLLFSLLGAVGCVLLIACVNVANLLLVRATGRGRDLSVRTALGGGRARLMRQLLAEAVVLGLLGGALGLALAWASLPLLEALVPPELPRLGAFRISLPVLGFSLAATLSAAVLFGTLPALRGARVDVMHALRERSGPGNAGARVRSALVVAEVALSFVLIVGAGLMTRRFIELHDVETGFRSDGVLAFDVALPPGAYPSPDAVLDVMGRLREALLAVPGVDAVGLSSGLPLGGGGGSAPYGGDAELADGDESDLRQANIRAVSDGYFETLGTPLLAGRMLTRADAQDSVVKVLVDGTLAERTWPGESAVGKRIYVKVAVPGIWFEVAGVVGHQRHEGLAGPSRESIYFPPFSYGGFADSWVVRTGTDPTRLAAPVRDVVTRIDERILLENLEPLVAREERARAPTALVSMFVAAFGGLALVLALVGLYGVMAYLVRERRGEFGLRIALGAERGGILALVLRRGLVLAALGVVAGGIGAVALSRALVATAVDAPRPDPLTLGLVAVLFGAMAAAASLVPARRAVGVDPALTLREE